MEASLATAQQPDQVEFRLPRPLGPVRFDPNGGLSQIGENSQALVHPPPLEEAPGVKKQKVGEVKSSNNKKEGGQLSSTTMMIWINHVCLKPDLTGIPELVDDLCEALKEALPKSVTPRRFSDMVLRAFAHNLHHKVATWTAPIRYACPDHFALLHVPTALLYVINAFKPIAGAKNINPSLYPDLPYLTESLRAMLVARDLVPFDEDPTDIGSYEMILQRIPQNLGRTIFGTDLNSESLLDTGYLSEGVNDDVHANRFGRKAVCRRQLSRREELLATTLGLRAFERLGEHLNVYVPCVEESETEAIGCLMAYLSSDRPVTKAAFMMEFLLPNVMASR